MTELDEAMKVLFEEAGYTYPGAPLAAMQMAVREIQRAKAWAESERSRYTKLLEEVVGAVAVARVSHGGDPVKALADARVASATLRVGATVEETEIIMAFYALKGEM